MRGVQRQLAAGEALPRRKGREVEEAEGDRLLQLEDVVLADEDGGDVRLDRRRRAGQARQQRRGLALLGGDAQG
jgi:hypothetical protein